MRPESKSREMRGAMHDQSSLKLGLLHEDIQQSRIVGSSKSSDRVPAHRSQESIGVATGVASLGNVEERFRVLVQNRVDETDSRLASRETLLVDASQNRSEHGGRG